MGSGGGEGKELRSHRTSVERVASAELRKVYVCHGINTGITTAKRVYIFLRGMVARSTASTPWRTPV